MNGGWIKWYRKGIHNPLFKDPMGWHLWEYLCLKACHEDTKVMMNGVMVELKRGQLVFGRKQASIDTGIPESTIYRRLRCFEIEQQMDIKSNNKFSVITISNYGIYQTPEIENEQQTDQQMNSKRTTKEHIQEVKKYKNIRKNISMSYSDPLFLKFWEAYPKNGGGKKPAYEAWKKLGIDEPLFDRIVAALETQKTMLWKDREPGKIPHAATWLNQARWEAEIGLGPLMPPSKPKESYVPRVIYEEKYDDD